MNKDKKFNIYFMIIAFFCLSIAVLRSIKAGITFDESITYLKNIYEGNFVNNALFANNHLLNTFFIFILTKLTNLEFNEFIIRTPNLIFYVVYIIYTYKLSKLYKNKYSLATVLLFNYSVNEFASVARGYAMAASLVLAAIFYYKKWLLENENKNLIKSFFLLLGSSTANTITLIIFGCFALDAFIRLIRKKELILFLKKNIINILLLSIFFTLLLIYHFYVSFNDKYLLYCKGNFIECLIHKPLNYYGINLVNLNVIWLIILILIVFTVVNIKNIKFNYDNIFYMIILILFTLLILKFIFPFNFPNGRALIPFYSIYIISLFDFLSLSSKKSFIKFFMYFISFISIVSFFKNLNINYTREWPKNTEVKILVQKKYKNKELVELDELNSYQNLIFLFYYIKYKKQYHFELTNYENYIKIISLMPQKKE